MPGSSTSFSGSARSVSAAWESPRPSTRSRSRISSSEIPASRATWIVARSTRAPPRCRRPRRGRGSAGPSRGAPRRGTRARRRSARRPRPPCSAACPTITRSAGRNMTCRRGRRAAQLGERHARRRRAARSSARRSARCSPSSPSSRPSAAKSICSGSEHRHGRTTLSAEAGVRRRAQNHSAMIVLGIDPGLANTGYGVVARRRDGAAPAWRSTAA